jgi:predicted lipoprotein with Yx(FWY)xxD motif
MKKLLILLATIVAAVALAACGGGSGSDDSASAADPGDGTVAVQDLGDSGRVLVDSSGKALYASDLEESGAVMCTDACESFWTPLTVKGGKPTGSVPGQLGVINRPDGGGRQVTFNGMPLYSFNEEGSGEVTGDGFQDAFDGQTFTWNVVSVGGGGSSPDTSSAPDTSSGGSSDSGIPGY